MTVTDLFGLIIIAIILSPANANNELVISACCGNPNLCQTYSMAEQLFGLACCNETPYSEFSHICCNGSVYARRQGSNYIEQCCGNATLTYDQTCCNGAVTNMARGTCCGTSAYDSSDSSLLCCNGSLVRGVSSGGLCCGAQVFYSRNQICCGGVVSNLAQADSCCTSKTTGTSQAFLGLTSFCCDVPVPRYQNMSCCYLMSPTLLHPVAYHVNTQCCRYPYQQLYPYINGSCIPST